MRFGVDYSGTPPSIDALKKENASFVCRYLSTPGNPKNINRAEALRLRSNGLDVVLVFETTATRALGGASAGKQDAKAAREQATACGAPAGQVIYFAVDFDANATELRQVKSYLAGAASVLGADKTGVYGGYAAVKAALDAGVCKYAWQTYAWSGGKWDPRAHLQQYANAQTLGGVEVDHNHAVADDFGQWPAVVRKPAKPPVAPKPVSKPPLPPPDVVTVTGPKGGLIARRPLKKIAALVAPLLRRFGRISLRRGH
jgi:hypothetical protein